MTQLKIALDIATQIKEENVRGKDRLPSSDVFNKKISQKFAITEDEVNFYINQLKETHYIFTINSVIPEPNLYVQGIDTYAFAELSIINELKHIAETKLMQVYESNFYKRKTSFQIIRELGARTKEYNNTAIGRALSEAMRLEELHTTITSNAFEYTDSWRKEKILKLYREHQSSDDSNEEQFQQLSKRSNSSSITSKWQKLTNQFSVEFLVRIHFRKYEFDVVKKLILQNKITKLKDLLFIRNTLKNLQDKTEQDIILKYYLENVIDLRRLAQAKINILRKSENHLEGKISE